MRIERLLAYYSFENWGKLDNLGLEIDTNALKSGN